MMGVQVGFPDDPVVKNLPANSGNMGDLGLIPGPGRPPGGDLGVAAHPIFWPGDSLRQGCQVGYSPQGCEQSNTPKATEHKHRGSGSGKMERGHVGIPISVFLR